MNNAIRLLPLVLILGLLVAPALLAAEGKGRIEGRVLRTDGNPLPGVGVALEGSSFLTLSDGDGRFRFAGVPAGSYSLTFTLLDNSLTRTDVIVTARASTSIEQVVDWNVGLVETVTVRSASMRMSTMRMRGIVRLSARCGSVANAYLPDRALYQDSRDGVADPRTTAHPSR